MRPIRLAVLGGGNGISAVLSGFARRVRQGLPLEIRAIVATGDDGGSSGRLRQERGGIPPGDLRNCLIALASGSDLPFARLFGHRYDGQGELAGHSLGNLILTAMAEQEGSYLRAADWAGEMLDAMGRVLPVSLAGIRLEAETRDGVRISGESRIGRSPSAVHRVWLDPLDATPAPGVVDAIHSADLLVLGPGSLFTSLLAVLLVPGVRDAVRACRGHRVLIANLMTQPGETLGMSLNDHVDALERHAGAGLVQSVLANGAELDPDRVRPYEAQGSEPILALLDPPRPERLVVRDLITAAGKIRHDPETLADALLAFVDPGSETSSARRDRAGPPSPS